MKEQLKIRTIQKTKRDLYFNFLQHPSLDNLWKTNDWYRDISFIKEITLHSKIKMYGSVIK
ncbi:MAG: hypothetical protein LH615_04835 [Ferruginibacter sp.]|nr:hypothetical protein [Ferruginibacter sp.]